jgi:hypothetical protein
MGAQGLAQLAVTPLRQQIDVQLAQHRPEPVRVVAHRGLVAAADPQPVRRALPHQARPEAGRMHPLQRGQHDAPGGVALGRDRLHRVHVRNEGPHRAAPGHVVRAEHRERVAVPGLHDRVDGGLIGLHGHADVSSRAVRATPIRSAIPANPVSGIGSQSGRFSAS